MSGKTTGTEQTNNSQTSPCPIPGPALAARYLIPALVDCIGRLTIAAATSSPSACAPFSRPNFYQSPEPIPNNTASTYTATEDSFNDTGPRRTSSAEHLFSEDCCCQGDPASRVLFQHCIGRDASGKALDAGIGEGESLLVLSRPLGDICLSVRRRSDWVIDCFYSSL